MTDEYRWCLDLSDHGVLGYTVFNTLIQSLRCSESYTAPTHSVSSLMWDRCAPDDRHPRFESGALEAVVAWSAPPVYHPAAVPFINKTFNSLFDGKPWNFTNKDLHHQERAMGTSQVMSRHKRDAYARLPSSMY